MIRNKHIIKQALCMSDLQYGEMVMCYANSWMRRYFNDEVIVGALNHSGWFWKWWINQWDNRDNEFVRIASLERATLPLEGQVLQATKTAYELHHDVHQLRIVPNRMVVNEVGKLILQEKQKIKQLKS